MRIFSVIAAALILTLTSCGTVPATVSTNLNGEWKLQNDNSSETGMSDEPLSIAFDVQEAGKITGFGGCNYYGGNYSKVESGITFSEVYSTKRACPDLDDENRFFELLNKTDRFEIKGNNLYFYQDNLLLLHFKR